MAKKVLIIHNRIHLGGPIFIVGYLTKYLAPEFEMKLVVGPALPDEMPAVEFLNELGVSYELLPQMQRYFNPFLDIVSFFKVRKIIAGFKPDIVHTHTAKAGAVGRLAAWSKGVPVIIHTFHGHVFHSYFSRFTTWVIKLAERFLARRSTAIIAISELQKKELGEKYRIAASSKIHMIPIGLELDRFSERLAQKRDRFRQQYGLNNDQFAVALIGRFAPVKNHHLFFDTLVLLKQQYPGKFGKMTFFLVGDGELRKSFFEILEAAGIPYTQGKPPITGGSVVFTSWITQVHEVMPAFDAVILTSHSEGTPLSLIESQAAGVPVISTNVGGVEDVVLQGKTGLIVPAGSAQGLADALIRFLDHPAERLQMGIEARHFIQSGYSHKRMVSDTRALYLRLLQSVTKP